MLTAIFPIRIFENLFWSSDTGLGCIDIYLKMLGAIPYIDRFNVITRDTQVYDLAEKHGMQVLNLDIPGTIDRPYTFAQTLALAQNFQDAGSNPAGDLIIADHRNLLLSPDDLGKAWSVYQQNPNSDVISLSFCRDHPCQYKTYFTFLGCTIFHFKDVHLKYDLSENLSQTIKHTIEGMSDISVTVNLQNTICEISVDCKNKDSNGLVAQILPFTADGPLYESFYELYVSDEDCKVLPNDAADRFEGVIVTMVMADSSGIYDSIECFTPENADWELGVSGNKVIDKENHKYIQGRQQFSPVYTYDGSFCFIHTKGLNQKERPELLPVIVNDSCIVSDWIDYLYSIK